MDIVEEITDAKITVIKLNDTITSAIVKPFLFNISSSLLLIYHAIKKM